jgi:hypothetical protein
MPEATVTIRLPIPENVTVVHAPPDLVSQGNVEQVAGIPRATYLEMLRAPNFPLKVTRWKRWRLVDRAAFVGWLREGAPIQKPPLAEDETTRLMRELNLRPTGE